MHLNETISYSWENAVSKKELSASHWLISKIQFCFCKNSSCKTASLTASQWGFFFSFCLWKSSNKLVMNKRNDKNFVILIENFAPLWMAKVYNARFTLSVRHSLAQNSLRVVSKNEIISNEQWLWSVSVVQWNSMETIESISFRAKKTYDANWREEYHKLFYLHLNVVINKYSNTHTHTYKQRHIQVNQTIPCHDDIMHSGNKKTCSHEYGSAVNPSIKCFCHNIIQCTEHSTMAYFCVYFA